MHSVKVVTFNCSKLEKLLKDCCRLMFQAWRKANVVSFHRINVIDILPTILQTVKHVGLEFDNMSLTVAALLDEIANVQIIITYVR